MNKLTPLPVGEWAAELQPIIDDMNGRPINVHALMANHPALLQAWWNFRNYSVNGGALGKRLGELVILRVAIHMQAWYEWGSHVERSLACGISMEEIERVNQREPDHDWAANESALLRAVDELIASQQISPPLLQELNRHFSPQQIMDIIAIHGMYVILACMIKTWGLELDQRVAANLPAEWVTQQRVPELR